MIYIHASIDFPCSYDVKDLRKKNWALNDDLARMKRQRPQAKVSYNNQYILYMCKWKKQKQDYKKLINFLICWKWRTYWLHSSMSGRHVFGIFVASCGKIHKQVTCLKINLSLLRRQLLHKGTSERLVRRTKRWLSGVPALLPLSCPRPRRPRSCLRRRLDQPLSCIFLILNVSIGRFLY